jgi:hypothetical protein
MRQQVMLRAMLMSRKLIIFSESSELALRKVGQFRLVKQCYMHVCESKRQNVELP